MGRSRSGTRGTPRSYPRGSLQVSPGGYGFVETAEGEFYIPADRMNGAFDGDLVEISPARQERSHKALARAAKSTKKREARVKRVIEHAHASIVGRFEHAEPFGVVVPEDPRIPYDIFTMLADNPDIPDGSIVRVEMVTYPSNKEAATGRIVEVLGDADDERVPIDLIVARYKFETAFSEAALAQAADARVGEDAALSSGYCDLRDRFVFTIDPDDARDFDGGSDSCADSAEGVEEKYWRVGVHIADVAHYVPWGSSVDLDARRRATSVYLVDRVIPMLPEELSNDICSLKPNEVRRTMTVDMLVNDAGEVVDVDIYPALIRSNARLTYGQAQRLIEGEEVAEHAELASEIAWRVQRLSGIAKQRMKLREAAGGLDFDTAEAKVKLDGEGVPVDIVLRSRTDATQLIEEAMIAANEAVARFLRDAGFPGIFRVHEKPSRESLEGLVPVLQEFPWFKGISVDRFVAGNPHEIAKVLSLCEGRNEGTLVTTLVLRSMKRAVYEPELDVHFALASEAYCHFTSPIRRYPDLVVHRMLKAALGKRPEKFDQEASSIPWIAEHCSEMERAAERAARDSQEAKIVELMELSLGQTFSAVVAGVAPYGMFVRLDNTAEGMVDIADLGREYFVLDSVRHTLTGSDTGKQYRLGKRVAVRLVEADRRTSRLRFKLA
jgi:ribonuclease R